MRFDPAHVIRHFSAMHPGHGIVEYDCLNWFFFKQIETAGSVDCGQNSVSGAFKKDLSDFSPTSSSSTQRTRWEFRTIRNHP